jgi:phenylacetate-CoA ligase
MSLLTKCISGLLFPAHEALKRHSTIAVHKEMQRNQWLTPEKMEELRVARLRGFLCDIQRSVPFYRRLFKAKSFDPRGLTSVADLQQLPLMGKPEIRQSGDELKSENALGLQRFNTGGSTGEPLVFYLGRKRVSHDVAAKRRATRWWDVDIGDPEIVVWGSPIELGSQDRIRKMRDRLFRTQLISAFEMSDDNLDLYLEQIIREKPKMLFGYPSSIAHIAEYAKRKSLRLDDLGIKVVFVTSERLYEHQQESIEDAFGCPVANGYGGRDSGFIAHACPSGSMHITAEDIIVEIVDANGSVLPSGESGQIVITHMATNDFPFVRYMTGDVGALSDRPCECGRGLPVLEKIDGRTTDFVLAQDGTVVHGLALIYVLRDIEAIQSFKIIQETTELLRIQLVVTPQFGVEWESVIAQSYRKRLGASVELVYEYLDEIPREKSGKYRYVVSHVQ